jgi:hypothetical protein
VAIDYDYDATTNFKAYKTYHFYEDLESGLTELDERRLLRALDEQLKRLGYTKSQNPDFLIDIRGIEVPVNNSPSIDVGFAGTGTNTAGGIGVNVPVNSQQDYHEMSVEFVDRLKEETFWMAKVNVLLSSSNEPLKRDAFFRDLSIKILNKFPPEDVK